MTKAYVCSSSSVYLPFWFISRNTQNTLHFCGATVLTCPSVSCGLGSHIATQITYHVWFTWCSRAEYESNQFLPAAEPLKADWDPFAQDRMLWSTQMRVLWSAVTCLRSAPRAKTNPGFEQSWTAPNGTVELMEIFNNKLLHSMDLVQEVVTLDTMHYSHRARFWERTTTCPHEKMQIFSKPDCNRCPQTTRHPIQMISWSSGYSTNFFQQVNTLARNIMPNIHSQNCAPFS